MLTAHAQGGTGDLWYDFQEDSTTITEGTSNTLSRYFAPGEHCMQVSLFLENHRSGTYSSVQGGREGLCCLLLQL